MGFSVQRARDFFCSAEEQFAVRCDGFVYIVKSEGGGPVKIGIAVLPQVRLLELQTGNWHRLRIAAVLPVFGARPRAIELEAHRLAANARVIGEWFDLDTLEAVGCVLTAAVNVGYDPLSIADVKRRARDVRDLERVAEEQWRKARLLVKLGMD